MARPGLTRHRKFLRLARSVGGEALAFGLLGLMWESAYESGDDLLGDADDLEACARWTGERGQLAAAMTDAGFVDERDGQFYVHDLWHHAPDYVQKRRRREAQRRTKTDPVRSVDGQCPVNGEQLPTARRELLSLPAPSTQHPREEPPNPLAPARGNRRPRARSMSTTEIEAAIDAIRSRHYPNPVTGPDATQLDRLRAELRGKETA